MSRKRVHMDLPARRFFARPGLGAAVLQSWPPFSLARSGPKPGALSRPAAQRVGPGWAFEHTPALRSVVVLSAGALGKVASEAGMWLYWWLLAAGEWPEGSEMRGCLKAAGAELRFVAEQLAGLPGRQRTCQKVHDQVAWTALQLGEEVPAWTPGAFRDPLLLHVTDGAARQAFEDIGLRLWEWAAGQVEFSKLVAPGVAADLRMMADYFGSLTRLAEQSTQDQHLAGLAVELALETAKLAQEIEL